jgi:hypothetical protein
MQETTKFQNRIEAAVEESEALVFPHAIVKTVNRHTGSLVRDITWHTFMAEDKFLNPGDVGMSACRQIDYKVAQMPKRATPKKSINICRTCARVGQLSEAQMRDHVGMVFAKLAE